MYIGVTKTYAFEEVTPNFFSFFKMSFKSIISSFNLSCR